MIPKIESSIKLFRYYKSLAERAMSQVKDEDLTRHFHEDDNSIAIIVNHLSGNMKSRWTGFPKEDGEKVWRQRDQEFEAKLTSRQEIQKAWEEGWSILFEALVPLQDDQLYEPTTIRNEEQTIGDAIERQIAHYAYHIGQIVFLAKYFVGDDWQTLSIAKGKSADYNATKFGQEKTRVHFTDRI